MDFKDRFLIPQTVKKRKTTEYRLYDYEFNLVSVLEKSNDGIFTKECEEWIKQFSPDFTDD